MQLSPDGLPPDHAVESFLISPDGTQVVYRFGHTGIDWLRLYSASLNSPARTALTPDLGDHRDVVYGAFFSADGRWLLSMADRDIDDVSSLYALEPTGGPPLRLSGTAAGSVNHEYERSADGRRVVFLAELDGSGAYQLYSVLLPDAPSVAPAVIEPTSLSGPLPTGASIGQFQISRDSARVIYHADLEQDDTFNLSHVPAAGGPHLHLNGDLVTGGDVSWACCSSTGSRVIYRADQEQNGLDTLSAIYKEAPQAAISGPSEPVQPGVVEVMVSLSKPMAMTSAAVRLAPAAGDAVRGRDYRLPGDAEQLLVTFAPGETSKALPLTVLDNPARGTAPSLVLQLTGTASAELDTIYSVELTLAAHTWRVYLPLTIRSLSKEKVNAAPTPLATRSAADGASPVARDG